MAIATRIFHISLDNQEPVKIDRVHRSSGPKWKDLSHPRDIICRLHHYSIKDAVIQRAWQAGTIRYEGTDIKILPDLSRAALQRRTLLQPLLDPLRAQGNTYRWGYPFHLLVHRGDATFTLYGPEDLPHLFEFLDMAPIEVPNWMTQIPPPARRFRGPRGQRARDRPHTQEVNNVTVEIEMTEGLRTDSGCRCIPRPQTLKFAGVLSTHARFNALFFTFILHILT